MGLRSSKGGDEGLKRKVESSRESLPFQCIDSIPVFPLDLVRSDLGSAEGDLGPEKVRGSINLTKIMTWKQTCRSWFLPDLLN